MSLPSITLRACIAPLLAVAFVLPRHGGPGVHLMLWELLTFVSLGVALQTRALRHHPGAAAGLVGVIAAVALVASSVLAEASDGIGLLVLVGGALGTAVPFAWWVERRAHGTSLPSMDAPVLTLVAIASCVLGAGLSTRTPEGAPAATLLQQVQLAELASTGRERLMLEDGARLEVEVNAVPMTDGMVTRGGNVVLRLERPGAPELTSSACQTSFVAWVDVLTHDDVFEVRWPVSPHADVYGRCEFDRNTLARLPEAHRSSGAALGATLLLAPGALLVLAWAGLQRRRHARIARSPELRVTGPGLATMPDGSLVTVPTSMFVGQSFVALSVVGVAPDYRADARLAVDELAVGSQETLLREQARRVRTLEIFALLAVLLVATPILTVLLDGVRVSF